MLERDGRAVGFNDMGAHVVDMAQKGIVAERHLRYQLVNSATPNVETSHFIDLARDLSAINRRLYEQGRYYKVARVTVTSRNTYGGLVSVCAAPSTWVVVEAWKKARMYWLRQQKEVAEAAGVKPQTWADFKVYLSDTHRTGTVDRPRDNGNNVVSSSNANWDYSEFVSPDGTTSADPFWCHLLGADNGSAGNIVSAAS